MPEEYSGSSNTLKLVAKITTGLVLISGLLIALGQFTTLLDPFLPKHVGSIELTPGDQTIRIGDQLPIRARVLDTKNNAMPAKTVTWASKSPDIATVSAEGIVEAKADGVAAITATCDTISSTDMITVKRATVSKVNIWPEGGHIVVNDALRLEATALDADGNVLPGKRALWASDNSQVARVESDGVVRGLKPGQASVSANIEGQVASVPVPVDSPPVQGGAPAPLQGQLLIRPTAAMLTHVMPQVTIVGGLNLSACTGHLRLALGGVLTELTSNSQTVTVSEPGNANYSFGGTVTCQGLNLHAQGAGSVVVAPGKSFKVQAQRRAFPPMVTVTLVQ